MSPLTHLLFHEYTLLDKIVFHIYVVHFLKSKPKYKLLTQSKSKTQITRSVHGKFNCINVKYNGT